MAEQQHIDLQVLKTKMPESFAGTFIVDMSGGLEKVPISAINSISNEYLTTFHYISQIQYPLKYRPDPPSGCDCVGGCSLSQKCACAVKNGGGFHFNDMVDLRKENLLFMSVDHHASALLLVAIELASMESSFASRSSKPSQWDGE